MTRSRPTPDTDVPPAPSKPAIGAPLPHAFYARPVLEVARDLLGCILVQGETAGRIVETEAYHVSEGACHAYRRPPAVPAPTPSTRSLFGPPGHVYVYRSYGIHAMVNPVCEPEGHAAAVLVRALEPVAGIDRMRARRPGRTDRELASGPGRLTLALDVALDQDGEDLAAGRLRIVAPDPDARPPRLVVAERIGIRKATDLPWRFADATSEHVSRPLPPGMRADRRSPRRPPPTARALRR